MMKVLVGKAWAWIANKLGGDGGSGDVGPTVVSGVRG